MTDWLPYVQSEVHGCPRPMVFDAIRQALIIFCQKTRFWRFRCNNITTIIGVNTEYAMVFVYHVTDNVIALDEERTRK
jgi:DMSO reductase anchor subunit